MIKLELTVDTPKGEVHLVVGEVSAVPAVGDWVDREDSGWRGLVTKRWWHFDRRGRASCRLVLDDGRFRGNAHGNSSEVSKPDDV